MKTALIFGISGQDGAYLARFLLQKGYRVHGTSRDHELNPFNGLKALGIENEVELSSMNSSDFRSVYTTLKRVDADEIYNLAGQSSVGLSFEYPIETFESISLGTVNILECIRLLEHRGRFYNASSSEMFGNTTTPADESTPLNPRSPYAIAKATAHQTISVYREAYGLFACSGILFNHESPLRPERFVTRKITTAAARIAQGSSERLRLGRLDVMRDWGWAPEYVDAMWRMLQQEKPEDFLVSTGESASLERFTEIAFSTVGLCWRDYVDEDATFFRPSDIAVSQADPSAARERLGWEAGKKIDAVVAAMMEHELEGSTDRR